MSTRKDSISAIRTLASQSTITILRTVARRTNWTLSGKDRDALLAGYLGKLAKAEEEWGKLEFKKLQELARTIGVKKRYGVKSDFLIDSCLEALEAIWKSEIKRMEKAKADKEKEDKPTKEPANKKVLVGEKENTVEEPTEKELPSV